MKFESELGDGDVTVKPFDLFRFTDPADYLCYVEAVHKLYHQNERQDCDFLKRNDVYYRIGKFEDFGNTTWLNDQAKQNEYFFVVDNTEWPEALKVDPWGEPEKLPNPSKNIRVGVTTTLRYTANNKFASWTYIFAILLILFGGALICTIICFCRQKYLYMYYAKERKQIKRQLEIIKETEYANF